MKHETEQDNTENENSVEQDVWRDVVKPKKRKQKRQLGEPPPLSINSLMDIVTIILVYLIKSFATSPIDVNDPSIDIPASTSMETVEDGIVVMVTGDKKKMYNSATKQLTLVANNPILAVDDKLMFKLEARQSKAGGQTWRVPASQKAGGKETSYVINNLKLELVRAKKEQEALATALNDGEFIGKVVILADKSTPYKVLMDILVTCGQAGFGEFRFAILQSS